VLAASNMSVLLLALALQANINITPQAGKAFNHMSKASIPTQAPEATKAPRTLMVREVVPWFLVTILTFAAAGTISGWFLHANVAVSNQAIIAAASKDQSR
jgi:hypothetical protein